MTVIRSRRTLPPSLVLVLAAGAAACTPSGEAPTERGTISAQPEPTSTAEATASPEASASERAAGEEEVLIVGARFEPAELTIVAGTEVVFVNEDGYGHTVTEGTEGRPVEDAFVDSEVPANATVRVVFDEPGTFDITCIIHPTMQMTITVED